ncbi:C39 family peptidase [Lactiplantibacillus sp. WILCCON 0030]|uniref:C39 family peptidase n=1 Tax=Lactiplantibacillus brownii TaxID=3069269 RepID=A0ABU1A7Q3_9LACO|nr:C39 family peptidase [Lactiplantibacillus brownii]MDQ7936487.1 C39 family peptidase [Lactiplantibacillus brownii]
MGNKQWGLVGGLSLLLGLGLSQAQIVHAASTDRITGIRTTTSQTFRTNSQTGKGYHITVLPQQRVHLRPNLQLSRHQNTIWTRSEQAMITHNGKKQLYYYVKNAAGQSGWIWEGYLTPASYRLKVPVVSQLPELPTGCEITAVDMMLQYAGAKVNKNQLANEMPRSDDPNEGFVGDPHSEYGYGLYVYPRGLLTTVQRHAGSAVDLTGISLTQLKAQITRGHPVVVWVTNIDGFASHALTVTGFEPMRIYFNDPWTGQAASLSNDAFNLAWQGNGSRALSY